MENIPKSAQFLKDAFKALLNGDTAERDRLCDLSLKALDEEERLFQLAPTDPITKN